MLGEKNIKKTITLLLAIVVIPVAAYIWKFGRHHLSDSPVDWANFGDYLGGVLNPYISILTLGVTSYIAYNLYKYENKRDTQFKQEEDVKSFMELYQFFISVEFREVRVVAWYMLKKAVYNERYKEFIIKENFVSRYENRTPRADVYRTFKELLYLNDHPELKMPKDEQSFLRQEALDRNKVDTLINFFQLLSLKNIPDGYFKVCDFYYDTWRPVLYWYSKELNEAYLSLGENKNYNNPPTLKEALEKLDNKFYEPQTINALRAADISNHPIIIHMKSGKP